MKCYKDFIVQVPEVYRDSITTPSGMKVYLDKRWSKKELVNTIVDIHETPMGYDGPIKPGYKAFIDFTLLFVQMYEGRGEQQNIHLLDKKNWLYKCQPELVIAYQEKEGEEWKGYGEHLLVKRAEPKPPKKIGNIHVPDNLKKKTNATLGKIFIPNNDTEYLGVDIGDTVYFWEEAAIDIKLGEEWLTWVRNKDLLAKYQKAA